MELIRKEKSRHITFKKRKEGLVRKIHEFTTLCDVDACMIIYGPRQENPSMEAEIWPENSDEIWHLINIYQGKSKDSATRVCGLQDFFHDRKKRVEDELDKMRKKNLESRYPTWIDPMIHLSEMELRKFAATVSDKLEVVKSRMEAIYKGNDHHHNHSHIQNRYLIMEGSQQQPHQMIDFTATTSYNSNSNARLSGLIQRGVELELMNQQLNIGPPPVNPTHEMHVPMVHYPAPSTVHDQEHHQMHPINQNSMMMLLMNENEHHHHQVQFGGNASSIQCTSFKYYESSSGGGVVAGRGGGVLDNMVYNHPKSLGGHYYGPSVQQMVPYMQYPPHLMPNGSPQMQSSGENDFNDIIQYRGMDQKPPKH